LKDIDDEFAFELTVDHLLRGLTNRPGDPRLEQAELFVGRGGGQPDHAESVNELRRKADAADGEIFDGALGLRAIVGAFRHLDLAHGVSFGTKALLGHWTSDRHYGEVGVASSLAPVARKKTARLARLAAVP
jgi:hypothetical protein